MGLAVKILHIGRQWLCLASKVMSPRFGTLAGMRRVLEDIADRLDGEYDGWETTIMDGESEIPNPQSEIPNIPLNQHMEVPMAAPINNSIFSTMVRSGRTTYFVDVKEAKNGNKFLAISENRLDSENKKQRTTVRVFGETVLEFRKAIDEATAALG